MRPSFAQFRLTCSRALRSRFGLAGCASLPPPDRRTGRRAAGGGRAEGADAEQYAAQDTGDCAQALAQAQAAMAAGREDEARRLALAAAADADLAYANSRAAPTRAEFAQRRAEIADLRRRLQVEAAWRRVRSTRLGSLGGGRRRTEVELAAPAGARSRPAPCARSPPMSGCRRGRRVDALLAKARSSDARRRAMYLAQRRVSSRRARRAHRSRAPRNRPPRPRAQRTAGRSQPPGRRARARRSRAPAHPGADPGRGGRAPARSSRSRAPRAMQDVEAAIVGVAGAQAAKLAAAREKEAAAGARGSRAAGRRQAAAARSATRAAKCSPWPATPSPRARRRSPARRRQRPHAGRLPAGRSRPARIEGHRQPGRGMPTAAWRSSAPTRCAMRWRRRRAARQCRPRAAARAPVADNAVPPARPKSSCRVEITHNQSMRLTCAVTGTRRVGRADSSGAALPRPAGRSRVKYPSGPATAWREPRPMTQTPAFAGRRRHKRGRGGPARSRPADPQFRPAPAVTRRNASASWPGRFCVRDPRHHAVCNRQSLKEAPCSKGNRSRKSTR